MNKKKSSAAKSYFTLPNFNLVKQFILQYGDKQTYCNRYNHNPHYKFEEIDVFLNPKDPHYKSQDFWDFDEIVMKTTNDWHYYHIRAMNTSIVYREDTCRDDVTIDQQKQTCYRLFQRVFEYTKNNSFMCEIF